jgi:hypothetical protein
MGRSLTQVRASAVPIRCFLRRDRHHDKRSFSGTVFVETPSPRARKTRLEGFHTAVGVGGTRHASPGGCADGTLLVHGALRTSHDEGETGGRGRRGISKRCGSTAGP